MRTHRCFLVILFLATRLPVRADTLKLKDGTMLEGEITAEDDSAVSIYLEFSRGTITQTRRINKAEIAEIVRWTPEQRANWRMQRDYERLQAYRLNAKDSYLIEYYDQTIDGIFQKFLSDHPDSPYTSNVMARITEWKSERTLVSAGNIRFRGRWSPAAEMGPLIARERGQKLLEQARWLIAQRRFESAIPGLQVVVHMKEHPELVSQAKPLLTSAYPQAVTLLERENQQLTNDIAIAERQFDQARQGVNEADALLMQAMSSQQSSGKSPGASQPVLEARAAANKAHSDLNSAQDHLDQLRDRSAVVVQRLTALKLQARDVTAASTASQASPSQSTPSPPSVDSPEVLATIVAWVKKNWPGMVIALLAILFLMSRFAKD
jgi:hypothetical protein